jgi:hypothetical protein
MPEAHIRIAAALGITPDRANNLLQVRVSDPQQQVYCIEIPEGVLGGLI